MKNKMKELRLKDKEKHKRKFQAKNRISKLFYKFLLFLGITLVLKGVKGWLKSKKREKFG